VTLGAADRLVWFFGYGSLMWNPGFKPDAFEPARLEGWHRQFCIVSRVYRGTPEAPGLVLGLAPGGHCVGRAIGVATTRADEVLGYLDDRENVGGVYVYERVRLPLLLLGGGATVEAWCYVARADHADYAGLLPRAEVLRRLRGSHGRNGSNADYARATLAHLQEMGIRDPGLEELVAELELAAG
jgi:cation transport protein ChaC